MFVSRGLPFVLAIFSLFIQTLTQFAPEEQLDIDEADGFLAPTVLIAILIRNKAPYLPYFFGHLERLNQPKNRTSLYVRVDHSIDNSSSITEKWLEHWKNDYHYIDYHVSDEGLGYENEVRPTNWTKSRYRHVIKLRQEALDLGRRIWSDFIFMVDVDVMLVEPNILELLMIRGETVTSPLLNCTNSEPYANFWGNMTEAGYYKRSDDYFDIRYRQKQGIFAVPMVHTAVLINLNHKTSLALGYEPPKNYTGPIDDIIIFSKKAQEAGFKFYIDNTQFFGYFPQPLGGYEELAYDKEVMIHLKMQAMLDHEGNFSLAPSVVLPVFLPPKSKLGFSEIYLINLPRRTDRRKMMQYNLDQLGIEVRFFDAVDGTKLNDKYLADMNINQLHGYYDPYHKRGLKFGEIGCFLSHYFIWQDMIEKGYERILILEDDLRFAPLFVLNMERILREANKLKPDWELIYIGRKRLSVDEEYVANGTFLVYPEYSYWTLSYIINTRGATKLLDQKPLEKLVAVDEYLPIMFNKHPKEDWSKHFSPRNLVALSPDRLLVEPYHYTGEPNYYSDTEDSHLVPDFVNKTEEVKSEL